MADPILKKGSATVTVTCTTDGASILYQLGTATEQAYSKPVELKENTLFKARATKDGMLDSDTAEQQINIQLPDLILSTEEGTQFTHIYIFNASSAFEGNYTGLQFRYTTDGTDPTADTGTVIDETYSFDVNKNCTVKVRAFATNNIASDVETVEISTLKVATPKITVA